MSVPSGKLSLVLFEGTEDERAFYIKAQKTKPYVIAYGVRYDLTSDEIKHMNTLKNLI